MPLIEKKLNSINKKCFKIIFVFFFVFYCFGGTFICLHGILNCFQNVRIKSTLATMMFVTSKIRETRTWNWWKSVDMTTTRSFRCNICRCTIDELLTEWLQWGKKVPFFFKWQSDTTNIHEQKYFYHALRPQGFRRKQTFVCFELKFIN